MIRLSEPRVGRCGHELSGKQRMWCSPECSAAAARAARLKAHFDITPEQYDQLLAAQGGACAVCKKPPKPGKRLAVDHDHKTGFIRGLLCFFDNRRLLGARTDAAIIALAEYVKDPPARRVLGDIVAPGRPPAKRKKRGPYRKRVSR